MCTVLLENKTLALAFFNQSKDYCISNFINNSQYNGFQTELVI